VDGADLPSYLQDSALAARPVAKKSASLDVGAALQAEAPRRPAARPTPQPAPVYADDELVPMPSTAPAPAARPSVAKRDVADAFRSTPAAMPPAPIADDEYA